MFQPDPAEPICSAKGCTAAAVWVLAWNNPKIHQPERRKTWLACDDHRAHLSEFLGVRGFLKDVVPFAEWAERERAAGRAGESGGVPGAEGPGTAGSGPGA